MHNGEKPIIIERWDGLGSLYSIRENWDEIQKNKREGKYDNAEEELDNFFRNLFKS